MDNNESSMNYIVPVGVAVVVWIWILALIIFAA